MIVQILVTGAQIFGKALYEAGKQAVKSASFIPESISRDQHFDSHPRTLIGNLHPIVSTDAKHSPQGGIGSDITGVRNATSTSATDTLTREHRMTLDEAHLILNAKRGVVMEEILKVRPCNI